MKKWMIVLMVVMMFTVPNSLSAAKPSRDVLHELVMALGKNDVSKAKSLLKPSVTLPEIREKTPLGGIQSLPSSKPNTTVMVGYFEQEFNNEGYPQRIAFIWEVTTDGEQISRIKVVADAANPHMNEQISVNEYKRKFHKEILVPAFFPFQVTHVDGDVTGNVITLDYRNVPLKFLLELKAQPSLNRGPAPKDYTALTLKNGKEVFVHSVESGYQVIFQHEKLEYTVKLEGENETFKPKKAELMEVVESMFPEGP